MIHLIYAVILLRKANKPITIENIVMILNAVKISYNKATVSVLVSSFEKRDDIDTLIAKYEKQFQHIRIFQDIEQQEPEIQPQIEEPIGLEQLFKKKDDKEEYNGMQNLF